MLLSGSKVAFACAVQYLHVLDPALNSMLCHINPHAAFDKSWGTLPTTRVMVGGIGVTPSRATIVTFDQDVSTSLPEMERQSPFQKHISRLPWLLKQTVTAGMHCRTRSVQPDICIRSFRLPKAVRCYRRPRCLVFHAVNSPWVSFNLLVVLRSED
jgi:hypothetical protein